MEYKSQHGQDKFAVNYFKNKKNGTFVDIGAHDGESLSNTYTLEKELNWNGICIEPMPRQYKNLIECRNCITYNCAIYDKNGTEKFLLVDSDGYPDMLSGISKDISIPAMSSILSESSRLGAELKRINVETRILNEILEEHQFYHIDFMTIDVEGAELKILSKVNFDKFYIGLLIYENGPSDNSIREFLKSKNFSFVKRLGGDDVFVNNIKK